MNEHITCHVDSCKYNSASAYCTLDSIEVGNSTNSSACNSEQTECSSFEQR